MELYACIPIPTVAACKLQFRFSSAVSISPFPFPTPPHPRLSERITTGTRGSSRISAGARACPEPASIRMESGSGGRRLRKTESAEMRWVVPGGACEDDEIESSDDGGGGADTPVAASGSRGDGCSDDYDDYDGYDEDEMLRQRLVRTGPRADSFDVEALDVPGVYRHQVRRCIHLSRSLERPFGAR